MKNINITTQRLKDCIDRSGMTREQIGKKLECDTSTITKYYTGDRKPSCDIIIKFSKLFNVSADYLLGLSDYKSSSIFLQSKKTSNELFEKIKTLHPSIQETALNIIDALLKSCEQFEYDDSGLVKRAIDVTNDILILISELCESVILISDLGYDSIDIDDISLFRSSIKEKTSKDIETACKEIKDVFIAAQEYSLNELKDFGEVKDVDYRQLLLKKRINWEEITKKIDEDN